MHIAHHVLKLVGHGLTTWQNSHFGGPICLDGLFLHLRNMSTENIELTAVAKAGANADAAAGAAGTATATATATAGAGGEATATAKKCR